MNKKLSLSIVVLAVVIFGGNCSQVFSQTPLSPAKEALLKELLAIIDVKGSTVKMMEISMPAMEKLMEEQLLKSIQDLPDMTIEERARSREQLKETLNTVGSVYARLKKRIDFGKIAEEEAFSIYNKYYTESEIKDLIAFYKTSTGKKSLELEPLIAQESIMNTNEKIMPVINEITEEVMKELREKLKKSN